MKKTFNPPNNPVALRSLDRASPTGSNLGRAIDHILGTPTPAKEEHEVSSTTTGSFNGREVLLRNQRDGTRTPEDGAPTTSSQTAGGDDSGDDSDHGRNGRVALLMSRDTTRGHEKTIQTIRAGILDQLSAALDRTFGPTDERGYEGTGLYTHGPDGWKRRNCPINALRSVLASESRDCIIRQQTLAESTARGRNETGHKRPSQEHAEDIAGLEGWITNTAEQLTDKRATKREPGECSARNAEWVKRSSDSTDTDWWDWDCC